MNALPYLELARTSLAEMQDTTLVDDQQREIAQTKALKAIAFALVGILIELREKKLMAGE